MGARQLGVTIVLTMRPSRSATAMSDPRFLRAGECDGPTDAGADSGRATATPDRSRTVAAEFRPVAPQDAPVLVELMRRTGVHFAGTRHDAVYRSIVADSLGPAPRITTVVAEVDGTVVGFMCAITSDAPWYWRTFVVRHPHAAAAMAWTRTRKLRRRIRYRRRKNALYGTDLVLTPRVELPPEVVERLGRRPPAHGSPRPGEHGRTIAHGLYMSIDPDFRGRGLGVPLFRELFVELRRAGAVRYDSSFSSKDPAAIRMHCNFPFTIYRLPGGYWASLRFADLDG